MSCDLFQLTTAFKVTLEISSKQRKRICALRPAVLWTTSRLEMTNVAFRILCAAEMDFFVMFCVQHNNCFTMYQPSTMWIIRFIMKLLLFCHIHVYALVTNSSMLKSEGTVKNITVVVYLH